MAEVICSYIFFVSDALELMSSVLVTGATGFVGRGLLSRLTSVGLKTSAISRGKKADFADDRFVTWLPLSELDDDFSLGNCDVLVHRAAAAGVRRFIVLSSVNVNGEESVPGKPFREDDEPAPEDAYGISKYEAEMAWRRITAETGLEEVIIRPPLVYGQGVKANFEAMMRWLDRAVPLPLGDVSYNQRSLVALDNLVDLIVTCLDHPAAANQTFLVSDGED